MSTPSFPSTILIIRHGEKPGDSATDSPADGIDLSARGYERAAALAPYVIATFGAPAFLFATQASKHSNRPIETITPLSHALELPINSEYADADYAALASAILGGGTYAGKLGFICWHHGTIPALTQALGGQPPVAPWPGSVFDRVWQLSYPPGAGGGQLLPVANLAQKLMFGDESV
ncbi:MULTISPECIES: histidine phosphatase family protein [Paraburkholderia]|uniref:Histidine phosphatase family protein n=1 Tax=Paraburkholderia podalyriae TaxID=1938811 RepID=A0ABR7Q187_9BURK|nr:histidine phosphatase family protein [Paraburkholderia podalyriae]MBC8752196.1 histidine phosphatase family protein [Paraburkholderia podalyriae]